MEEGRYKGRGVKGSEQWGKSDSGGDVIAIDLKLVDIEETLTTTIAFSGGAKPYGMARLKALGWTGENADDGSFIGIDANEVTVVVFYENYDGRPRMKVEIDAGGGGRFTMKNLMTDPEKRSFLAELQALAKRTPDKRGGGGQSAAQSRGGGGGGAAGGKEYPADWDSNGPPAGAPVDLG